MGRAAAARDEPVQRQPDCRLQHRKVRHGTTIACEYASPRRPVDGARDGSGSAIRPRADRTAPDSPVLPGISPDVHPSASLSGSLDRWPHESRGAGGRPGTSEGRYSGGKGGDPAGHPDFAPSEWQLGMTPTIGAGARGEG